MNSSTLSAPTSPRSATAKARRSKNSTSSPQLSIRIERWGEAPAKPDPELAALHAEIADLKTKLALYRRREQLDLEYRRALHADDLRQRCAPIIQAVCQEFLITIDALISHCKKESIALPRMLAMTLAAEQFRPQETARDLALIFGNRDHSTLIHAARAIQNRCDTDPTFAARVAKLRTQLQTSDT